ncbi:MAG: MBL fold metallo-hydrolase [Gemmatimonadetes bacterium]|nr:MBL fold metallo-hydrolase [Gemmatimonadota bacterium]
MRMRTSLALSLLALLASSAAIAQSPATSPGFTVEKLADGVYATIRREPPSLFFEPNNLFIIGERDVIIVDAQFSLASTRATLAALRRLTNKPVRYVINTHPHDDHITGNQVYRDAFPGVEFIAHRATRDTMVTAGAAKRADFVQSLPGTIGFFRRLLASGKGPAGAPITDEERAGFASDSLLGTRYLADAAQLVTVPATIIVDDRFELRQGARVIELLHLGGGHSAGDLVVHLPNERIVASGDLVVLPVPLVGSTSHPAAFAEAVAKLRALRATTIVPGHGPILHDDAKLADIEAMLRDIVAQVARAVARGDTLAAVRRAVDLTAHRDRFAGTSALQRFAFANYVTDPAVAAAFADAQRLGPAGEALSAVQRTLGAHTSSDYRASSPRASRQARSTAGAMKNASKARPTASSPCANRSLNAARSTARRVASRSSPLATAVRACARVDSRSSTSRSR